MSYEPREGIDYIVDLYAISGVEQEASQEEVKQALNERALEFHPDRLEGVAEEFQSKGERMAVLLNRARSILLDSAKREEYDEILKDWDGPLSKDGTPVISIERATQMELAHKTPEEVETIFERQTSQLEGMLGNSQKRLEFLESLIENSGEIDNNLRSEYEEALLQKDRSLAIQEAERSRMLGLPDIEEQRYEAMLGYGEQIGERVEVAKIEQTERLKTQALGGVSTRLALLSGEAANPEPVKNPISDLTTELPAYYEDQAKKVMEIAKQREVITEKRLANFNPSYPEEELQTEFKDKLIIGIAESHWLGAKIDSENLSADFISLPEDVKVQLEQGRYKEVIEEGFNILTFDPLEQIDLKELISTALEKYTAKYINSDKHGDKE